MNILDALKDNILKFISLFAFRLSLTWQQENEKLPMFLTLYYSWTWLPEAMPRPHHAQV